MKAFYLLVLMVFSLSAFAPPASIPDTKLKTLSELKIIVQRHEKEVKKQAIIVAADSAAIVILNKYEKRYGALETIRFFKELKVVASKLEVPYHWLLELMEHESGMRSEVINSIGATGLIQFMPSTARGLGTTTYALSKMTGTQQLKYVYKYFKSVKGKIKSLSDLHLYAFFPLAVMRGWSDVNVIKSKGLSALTIAKCNKGLDLNGDGQITVKEFRHEANKKAADAILQLETIIC